ncbi:hypothetical protein ACE01N_19665 [Saccharicrinis sp. FJH2]|uniref:hypothetical protein n=1 Tax=Saccharicrinis sp. FJH65 TaxID=3344659 RepID=UPI0035F44600
MIERKILFWNVGKVLDNNKLKLISTTLNKYSPNIVCIAEGSHSQNDCLKIEQELIVADFTKYYSPLLGKEKFGIQYISNGLKIFYKDCSITNDFDFYFQRQDGRIVKFELNNNGETISLIFLHNYSKNGDREYTTKQTILLSDLNQLLKNSKLDTEESKVVLLGDFNLEPWDNLLRTPDLLDSYFLSKHLGWAEKKKKKESLLFNPITEKMIFDKSTQIGGTFFSQSLGWTLFDYPIYNRKTLKLNFKIITEISNEISFDSKNGSDCDDLINNNFDHLPILVTLNL